MHLKYQRFIGIDYSGAQHRDARLPGLRIFEANFSSSEPFEVRPHPEKPNIHWTRKEVADWLVVQLSHIEAGPCVVGIDHALSFPVEYFALHALEHNWDAFLEDFCRHWPTDAPRKTVFEILKQQQHMSDSRLGSARWKRFADRTAKGAKSVFHFAVPGSVASSTHAGLPWIHYLRKHPQLKDKVHFWPFDGWLPEPEKSLIAEVYPARWNKSTMSPSLTQDQHDALCVAVNLRDAAQRKQLQKWFAPVSLQPNEAHEQRQIAQIEGWILGVE